MRRLFDIKVAVIGLILSSPFLLLACIAIMIESPGSPFFRQSRVGVDGKPFDLIKLRTMVHGAASLGTGLIVEQRDARILKVGRLLRRLSVDELPNLINVLRGEMSIIGPRPTVLSQVKKYDDRQLGRLTIRPGITGWAQINGRAALPWSDRIELDLWYVEHRSWKVDLKILARTFKMILTGHGVYRGETGGWR